MSELATLKSEGDVSIITLDDGKANVFSYPMLETLQKILSEIPKDKGSVIITGRDGMFSGGFDLKTFASGDVDLIKNMSSLGFKTLFDLYTFPRPVVAAISGHAVALGIFVVCCCDYRIGAKGKYLIGANEMRTNMVIPVPILELIRFRISQRHKYRAILGAEMYPIESAVDAGLMDEAVDTENLMESAMLKAKDLATMGHPSYTLTKELFIKDVATKINNALDEIDPSSHT